MPLPEKPSPQNPLPPPKATGITQPADPAQAKREQDYYQRVNYLKQLFPIIEKFPDWELEALQKRIELLLVQREEAYIFASALMEAVEGPEEEEDG